MTISTERSKTPVGDPAAALHWALRQYPGILWTTEARGVITSAWGDGLAALGLGPNDKVGMTLGEYFGTSDPQFPIVAAHRRVMQGEIVTLNQTWQGREYESRMQPLRAETGKIVGCLGISRDVTDRNQAARAMPSYAAQMQAGTERAPDYVMQVDRSGTITFMESTRSDYRPERVIGTKVEQWLRPETMPIVQKAFERTLANLEPQQIEIPAPSGGDPDHWYDARLRPIVVDGKAEAIAAVVYDITERKLVELQLREAREELQQRVEQRTQELSLTHRRLLEEQRRLQSILDNTTAVVYVKDAEGRYLLVNSQFTRIFQLPADQILGKTDSDLFSADVAARFRANDLKVQAERRAIQFEEVAPHHDGLRHYVSVKFPLGDDGARPCSVCGISTDITDRKEYEERLKREEHLLRRLLEMRERERKLLAYEIHDGLVQDIVAAKMVLEGRGGDRSDGARLDVTDYEQVLQLLERAIDEGRRMISELRPPILDEAGIIGSIEYLAAEHLQKCGRRVHFRHEVDFTRLTPHLEQSVFRIVQEALTNVDRHSSALEAFVELRQSGRRIHLEVRDEGVGFDPAAVSADRFGIRGIMERARLFGGKATIESRPGAGTRVSVDIPMDQPGST